MEITAASGRTPVQMGLREASTVFLLIGSLATSVGLLTSSAVITWVLFGLFLKMPQDLNILNAKVVPKIAVASSFIG